MGAEAKREMDVLTPSLPSPEPPSSPPALQPSNSTQPYSRDPQAASASYLAEPLQPLEAHGRLPLAPRPHITSRVPRTESHC